MSEITSSAGHHVLCNLRVHDLAHAHNRNADDALYLGGKINAGGPLPIEAGSCISQGESDSPAGYVKAIHPRLQSLCYLLAPFYGIAGLTYGFHELMSGQPPDNRIILSASLPDTLGYHLSE